jgi:hypothetical protein
MTHGRLRHQHQSNQYSPSNSFNYLKAKSLDKARKWRNAQNMRVRFDISARNDQTRWAITLRGLSGLPERQPELQS